MKYKNPQAFPQQSIYRDGIGEEDGMTLLDYFAGQALMGLHTIIGSLYDNSDKIAKASYTIAKAMLKEREKRNEN